MRTLLILLASPLVLMLSPRIAVEKHQDYAAVKNLYQPMVSHVVPKKVATVAAEKAVVPKTAQIKTKRKASFPLDEVSISSKFGPRTHPVLKRRSFHDGVDMRAKLNDTVKSISDGVVTYAGDKGALGNAVFVSHPGLKATSIYGHLNKVAVKTGAKVFAGAVVGYAGTTGRSTGVHLHLTVQSEKTGAKIEPVSFMKNIGVEQQPTGVQVAMAGTANTRSGLASTASSSSGSIASKARVEGDPALSSNSSNYQQAKVAELQAEIASANRKAESLKAMYAEGILARNKFVEAEERVNELRDQLKGADSKS